MNVPKVYIVILNWNRYDDTAECLTSINKLLVEKYTLNVVVVDNGSTDGSIEKLKKFNADNFKIDFINCYFGRGRLVCL